MLRWPSWYGQPYDRAVLQDRSDKRFIEDVMITPYLWTLKSGNLTFGDMKFRGVSITPTTSYPRTAEESIETGMLEFYKKLLMSVAEGTVETGMLGFYIKLLMSVAEGTVETGMLGFYKRLLMSVAEVAEGTVETGMLGLYKRLKCHQQTVDNPLRSHSQVPLMKRQKNSEWPKYKPWETPDSTGKAPNLKKFLPYGKMLTTEVVGFQFDHWKLLAT
ncbi:hypothetical protein J6590_043746 [Homalodisca vitripennis]|nr:hypothetical protein J6590_043746 [Homalodisca vitripennis]